MADSGIAINAMDQLSSKLRKSVESLNDPTPLLRVIGEGLVASTKERFEEEIDPKSQEWKLKESTIKQKQKSGFTKKLQRRGQLKSSITKEIQSNMLKVGTPVEYSEWLHGGTKNMEPKEIVGVGAEDERMIDSQLQNYLDGMFGS